MLCFMQEETFFKDITFGCAMTVILALGNILGKKKPNW